MRLAQGLGESESKKTLVGEELEQQVDSLKEVLKKGEDQAVESGIPFAQSMALGVTNERILIWNRSAWTGKAKNFLGEIPLSDINSVDFEKGRLGDLLHFELADGKTLDLESVKIDKGEDFVLKMREVLR